MEGEYPNRIPLLRLPCYSLSLQSTTRKKRTATIAALCAQDVDWCAICVKCLHSYDALAVLQEY